MRNELIYESIESGDKDIQKALEQSDSSFEKDERILKAIDSVVEKQVREKFFEKWKNLWNSRNQKISTEIRPKLSEKISSYGQKDF